MANKVPLVVYPAANLEKAKQFFTTFLGVDPYVDGAYYVGYKLDNMEFGLDPNGTAVISYVDTDDIEASLKTLQAAGAEVIKPSTDVGGGLLVAQVTIDGSVVGLRQQPVQ